MLEEVVNISLWSQLSLGSTSINNLMVENTTELYTVTFIMTSENATTENTRFATLNEMENMALPSRGDLLAARISLQTTINEERLQVECEGQNYRALPSSLTFQMLTYFCPPGQGLHSNYLICGE